MTEAYDGRQVVGMDLHRRRSVLVTWTRSVRPGCLDRLCEYHSQAEIRSRRQSSSAVRSA